MKLKRLFAICPSCSRRFDFALAFCDRCRIPSHAGEGRGGEIALWHLTQSAHGIVHHPPEWFNQETRAAKVA